MDAGSVTKDHLTDHAISRDTRSYCQKKYERNVAYTRGKLQALDFVLFKDVIFALRKLIIEFICAREFLVLGITPLE